MTRFALLLLLLAGPAAAQNIRILPDQAILACEARARKALETEGAEAMGAGRWRAEAMANFMFRVSGRIAVAMGGASREAQVVCEVSSSKGVELFVMDTPGG